MKNLIIISTVLLLVVSTGLMQAQIPRTLSYQGVLTDSLGNPKPDGVYTFTFRLYDVASGGVALWIETKDLATKRGLFSTNLGDITPFGSAVIFDRQYWLGVKPGADPELTPRIPLSAVGYSIRSIRSDTAAFALNAPAQTFVDSARIAGTIPNNAITTDKITDGTILRADVHTAFKAPYSDTADYAKGAFLSGTAGGDLTGTYPNPTIASNAVTTPKIIDGAITNPKLAANTVTTDKITDGTIQRVDVQTTFKAPYSDTADYARVAPTVDSWSITGNANTVSGTNFVGTTNAQHFDIRTNNLLRTRITTKGQIETYNTGRSVFVGEGAGANDDLSNNDNVFIGYRAGYSNTTGYYNTANGAQALYSNTTGSFNTANGVQALYSNTTGNNNTANGDKALYFNTTGSSNTANGTLALYSNTTGISNTANGVRALYSNTTGISNTVNGMWALYSNTTGNYNTANGEGALYSNVAGSGATAIGYYAMHYSNNNTTPFENKNVALGYEALRGSTTPSNNTGNANTALGYQTLYSNTTGISNTANGVRALYSNTTGSYNTANGMWALYFNTAGYCNTANGAQALYSNTTGISNTANGDNALQNNTTGNANTANGRGALYNITSQSYNTAVGYSAGDVYTFSNSTFLGSFSYPNASDYTNCMGLGYNARPTGSNRVHIGNTSITWIGGQVSWGTYSDGRYKRNVREDVRGLDFIMKLRPVTFTLDAWKLAETLQEDRGRDKDGNITTIQPDEATIKSRDEKSAIVQTGFIAQEVEQAAREVGYNFSGVDVPKDQNGHYGLRYAEFVVPLVKAVQELKNENNELRSRIEQLEKIINK